MASVMKRPASNSRSRWLTLFVLVLVIAQPLEAQINESTVGGTLPAPTSTLIYDSDGGVVIRATRITQPLRLDGRLDEPAYNEVSPITEFIQQEPDVGAPVTEKTEAWVLFDDDNIYVSCRCWDKFPDRIVANDMRRDSSNLPQHDNFAVALDTFHDRRNGFFFFVTPIGAIRDAAITDERSNIEWNGVWNGRAGRFDGGWIAEMAIPFKSLRYGPGQQQTWGIQFRRVIRSKNELVYLTQVSPAWSTTALNYMSRAATLVGLEVPPPGLNLEIKPYSMFRLTTDRLSRPPLHNDLDPDAGLDVKYGLTKSLTIDLTYNTDFAQVEADEAQINLTRFNLSFPEKREFFLEGQGLFQFGSGGSVDVPTIFYSRRIGLSGSRQVPVIGGARLTGKVGPWSVGAFNLTTDEDTVAGVPRTDFSVFRLRRNILRRSNLGAILTRRSASTHAPGANYVWGTDGNLIFGQDVYVSGYVAQSRTSDLRGNDLSYRSQFNYAADRWGLVLDHLVVEEHFNPEVGLLRRENFRRNFMQGRFSPRTMNHKWVRKWIYQADLEYITDNNNHLESRNLIGEFGINLHNGDEFSFQYQRLFEFLSVPFEITPRVFIPAGGYGFDNLRLSFTAGQQHRIAGQSTLDFGHFYDGKRTTATYRGRVQFTSQLGLEPNLSLNWIDLPQGAFTTTVIGARATFTVTPRMFVSSLVQYSSSSASFLTDLRFRWEYQPGSELFVVYTEGRSTLPPGGTELDNRGFVVKINRLFRF